MKSPGQHLDKVTRIGVALTIFPLLVWEWASLIGLALGCAVWAPICWIPAVATSGVMIASTKIHMTETLDDHIRRYAGRLAFAGITGGILGSAGQHYFEASHIAPPPLLAVFVGGVPCLMGGLIVHLVAMVFAQRRREQAEADQARIDADQRIQRQRRDEESARLTAARVADQRRSLEEHQRALTAEALKTATANKAAADDAERLRKATEARAAVAQKALSTPPKLTLAGGTASRKTSGSPQDRAIAWLTEQHRAGIDITDSRLCGPTKVSRATGASVNTCKAGLPKWRDAILELAEAAG